MITDGYWTYCSDHLVMYRNIMNQSVGDQG